MSRSGTSPWEHKGEDVEANLRAVGSDLCPLDVVGGLTYPGLVLAFFVSVEGYFVLSGGQGRNVDVLDTFEGHCRIGLLGFEEIDHHMEPERTNTHL